jgi:transposase
MLEVDQWAEIRRLHRDKVSVRAIARRLGLARNTVRSAIRSDEPPAYERARQPSCLDPFNNRIAEMLAEFPEISAVRLREVLQPEGFAGGLTILRAYLRAVRPQQVQAFQRTEYRPGAIGQLDWACMPDRIPSPTGELLPVWALLLTLGYSRLLSVSYSFSTKMPDFLRAHAHLLAFVGGTPHTLVYDNLSSVVVTHRGKEVTFNPQFLVFADRYCFKPHACTPGQPHEKGMTYRHRAMPGATPLPTCACTAHSTSGPLIVSSASGMPCYPCRRIWGCPMISASPRSRAKASFNSEAITTRCRRSWPDNRLLFICSAVRL